MPTTPLVSPASLRADQYVQQQGHTLLVDPRLIDVLGDLPTQVHRSCWPNGSFEIETVLESLLIPENGMVFPNAGLLPILAQLAHHKYVAWDAGAFDRGIAPLHAIRPELLPPGLAGFLSHAPRGRIRLGSGVHAALLIARISQAFPKARIVVLASRQDQLRDLEQAWVQLAETEQLAAIASSAEFVCGRSRLRTPVRDSTSLSASCSSTAVSSSFRRNCR